MYRLADDAPEVDFECNFTDFLCTGYESVAQGLSWFLDWLAKNTLGNNDLAPGTGLWDTAIGEVGMWFGIAIVVSLGIATIGIMRGTLQLGGRGTWVTLLGILSGIPATYLALTLGGALLDWSDQISDYLLTRIGGPDGFVNVIRNAQAAGVDGTMGEVIKGTVGFVPTVAMLLIMSLGILFMNVALAFRNFVIMILIAFSPLAFMAVTMQGGWSMARKWAMTGIALLMAKPLMFGVLAMVLSGAKGSTLFSAGTLTLAVGMFITAFLPIMVFSFFNFLGDAGGGDHVASAAAAQASKGASVAKRGGQQVGKTVGGTVGGITNMVRSVAGRNRARSVTSSSNRSTSTSSSSTGSHGKDAPSPKQPKNGQSAPKSDTPRVPDAPKNEQPKKGHGPRW